MQDLFLINPGSGKKRNPDELADIIHERYRKAGRAVETQVIDFQRIDEVLTKAESRGRQHIYAVGGDGTVNAVGTRLIHRKMKFGVIPQGSGNGFARNLGFSTNFRLAITQSLNTEYVKVDTARFNGTPFLNVAGVGLDAVVADIFSNKKKRGFGPYVESSAEGLLTYRAEPYRLTVDEDVYELENIIGLAVANGTQWGYDAKISPRASLTDGMLDVIIVERFPLINAGSLLRRLFSGRIDRSRYVKVLQGKRIRIERTAAGSAQVDGEPFQAGREIQIDVVPQSLNLVVPSTLTKEKKHTL